MITEIYNSQLTVKISDLGAELQSIRTKDGKEYLWQGNEKTPNHAPNIFPYIGQLYDGKYRYRGREYRMGLHGFVPSSVLPPVEPKTGQNSCEFELRSSEETYVSYPFRFRYRICYRLDGNTIYITNRVLNEDDKTMYFGLGGHPYINLPLDEGLSFEDYYLEFEHRTEPELVDVCEDKLAAGTTAGPIWKTEEYSD